MRGCTRVRLAHHWATLVLGKQRHGATGTGGPRLLSREMGHNATISAHITPLHSRRVWRHAHLRSHHASEGALLGGQQRRTVSSRTSEQHWSTRHRDGRTSPNTTTHGSSSVTSRMWIRTHMHPHYGRESILLGAEPIQATRPKNTSVADRGRRVRREARLGYGGKPTTHNATNGANSSLDSMRRGVHLCKTERWECRMLGLWLRGGVRPGDVATTRTNLIHHNDNYSRSHNQHHNNCCSHNQHNHYCGSHN